jgi:transcriptional regulator with XRE-family HTH domain
MSTALKEKIQVYLESNGIKIRDFERNAGLERSTLTNIFRGSSQNPGILSIVKIADAMNCSLDELLDRKEFMSIKKKYKYSNKLFQECSSFVTHYLIAIPLDHSNNLTTDTVIEYIEEIYNYSADSNLDSIDKRFATWLLNNKFNIE